jgi:hypothetical protein
MHDCGLIGEDVDDLAASPDLAIETFGFVLCILARYWVGNSI